MDSKNVFLLVLAHLEPELELFEVDDIADDGDYDWSHGGSTLKHCQRHNGPEGRVHLAKVNS